MLPVMVVHSPRMIAASCLLKLRVSPMHLDAVGRMGDNVLATVGVSVRDRLWHLGVLLLLFEQVHGHVEVREDVGRGVEISQARGMGEMRHVAMLKVNDPAGVVARLHSECGVATTTILDLFPILIVAVKGREVELQVAKLEEVGEIILGPRNHGRPGGGGLHCSDEGCRLCGNVHLRREALTRLE